MTLAEHCRWCISNIPLTTAERTIFWFLYGYDGRLDKNRRRMLRHTGIKQSTVKRGN